MDVTSISLSLLWLDPTGGSTEETLALSGVYLEQRGGGAYSVEPQFCLRVTFKFL